MELGSLVKDLDDLCDDGGRTSPNEDIHAWSRGNVVSRMNRHCPINIVDSPEAVVGGSEQKHAATASHHAARHQFTELSPHEPEVRTTSRDSDA